MCYSFLYHYIIVLACCCLEIVISNVSNVVDTLVVADTASDVNDFVKAVHVIDDVVGTVVVDTCYWNVVGDDVELVIMFQLCWQVGGLIAMEDFKTIYCHSRGLIAEMIESK